MTHYRKFLIASPVAMALSLTACGGGGGYGGHQVAFVPLPPPPPVTTTPPPPVPCVPVNKWDYC
jgi:hypothetical protein